MSENAASFPASYDDDESDDVPETKTARVANSNAPSDVGGVAGKRLLTMIERIERLNEELEATKEDIKEVYAEAKGTGFDVKTLRKIVGLRKQDAEKRREAEEILELYKSAIGMM